MAYRSPGHDLGIDPTSRGGGKGIVDLLRLGMKRCAALCARKKIVNEREGHALSGGSHVKEKFIFPQ
jgi:hypothetical protein